MDRWKSRGGKSQRREREKKEDQRRERQKKEDPGAQKVEKTRNTVFFQCFVVPEYVEKVHAVVAGSTFQSQNVKKHTTFGPLLDVQRHHTTLHYNYSYNYG